MFCEETNWVVYTVHNSRGTVPSMNRQILKIFGVSIFEKNDYSIDFLITFCMHAYVLELFVLPGQSFFIFVLCQCVLSGERRICHGVPLLYGVSIPVGSSVIYRVYFCVPLVHCVSIFLFP